jgi:hypothetical protein
VYKLNTITCGPVRNADLGASMAVQTVILALRNLRQENQKFETNMGYIVETLSQKKGLAPLVHAYKPSYSGG